MTPGGSVKHLVVFWRSIGGDTKGTVTMILITAYVSAFCLTHSVLLSTFGYRVATAVVVVLFVLMPVTIGISYAWWNRARKESIMR